MLIPIAFPIQCTGIPYSHKNTQKTSYFKSTDLWDLTLYIPMEKYGCFGKQYCLLKIKLYYVVLKFYWGHKNHSDGTKRIVDNHQVTGFS
jgi:hypothetical protein